MRREIGSEFWDVPITDNENTVFPGSTQWFLSGRSALQAIIQDIKDCHTVAMPSWCCESMIKPFVDAGYSVSFYPVIWDRGLHQNIDTNCDVLFLMDYFGYESVRQEISGYKGIVVRDITHSLFSTPYDDADYYFGSLRKWCGIWTGGYLWTRDGHNLDCDNFDDKGYVNIRRKAMLLKSCYINSLKNEHGKKIDKAYLNIYEDAEEILEHIGIVAAFEKDIEFAKMIDVNYLTSVRKTNADVLREAFSDWLIFPEMKNNDCPMFVPIVVPGDNRNKLRKYLIKNEIFCPVHWPLSSYHRINENELFLYNNELSLVCDQRYTREDMNRIVDTVNAFFEGV